MDPTDFSFDPTAARAISGVQTVLETQGLLLRGDNAPIGTTYCALVPQFGGSLAVEDARQDPRTALRSKATPVISYCGVLLRDTDGNPFGTLCHFDLLPCQQRTSDIEWLQLLSPMLARAALRQMAAVNPS